MACVNDIKTLLLRAGVRPSAQRIAVVGFLDENRNHPTVEEVYTALLPDYPTLSRTTVYNTVRLLADSGCISAISVDGEGMRLDFETSPHSHFLCGVCGKIYDLPLEEIPEAPDGFDVTSINVLLTGVCPCCDKHD